MTGQGQSAAGSAAWSAVFRHVRYENLVAGVSGGVLSNLALHPLDLVKIRFAGKSLPTSRAASLAGSPSEALTPKGETLVSPDSTTRGRAPKMMLCALRYLELEFRKGTPAFPVSPNPKG